MPYIGRTRFQRFVGALFTQRCKRDLRMAAARNKAVINSTLDLLRSHPEKIVSVMKEDRRSVPRQ